MGNEFKLQVCSLPWVWLLWRCWLLGVLLLGLEACDESSWASSAVAGLALRGPQAVPGRARGLASEGWPFVFV